MKNPDRSEVRAKDVLWVRRFPSHLLVGLLAAVCLLLLLPEGEGQSMTSPLVQHGPRSVVPLSEMWGMVRWSPYVAGAGIGVLSWLAFLLSNHPLGVSTAFARTAGMIEHGIRGPKTRDKAYYRKFPIRIDWEWMLVVGIVAGAAFSAWLSGSFALEWTPPLWEARFGTSALTRWVVAFAGGTLVGLGSRWAGGCTSGHGISGTLQLVASSWLAVLCFFIGGVVAAFLLYGVAP